MVMNNKEPIRILRIISRMNIGGPALQINNLMVGLDKNKFQQQLVFGFCGPEEKEFFENNNLSFDFIKIEGLGMKSNLIKSLISIYQLFRVVHNFQPQIIHTHTTKAGILGRIVAILYPKKIKIVHTYHGHILYGYFSPLKTNLIYSVEKVLGFFSTALVAVGNNVKIELIQKGIGNQNKFKVINPGIQQKERINTQLFLQNHLIPRNKFIVTYIGRFTKIKRIDRLFEVIKIISVLGDKIHFVLAGAGPSLEEYVKITIRESLPVTFVGWMSNTDELLNISDLIILTSDNEGTPLTLIEASMYGIPVVSTNVGSVSDVVFDGRTGFLTSKNPAEIAERVVEISSNKNLQNFFAQQTLINFKSKFLISDFIGKYEDLYKNL